MNPTSPARPPRASPSALSADESLYEVAFRLLLANRHLGEDCVLVLTEYGAEVPLPPRVIQRLADTGVPFAAGDQVNAPAGKAVDDFASDQPGHRVAILHVGVTARVDEATAKLELNIVRGPTADSPAQTVIARRADDGTWSFTAAGLTRP